MSISKMNIKKTNHDQYQVCTSKEIASGLEAEGEISGSVAVTGEGRVWLRVFLDDITVLARIHVFDRESGQSAYRFVVEKLEQADGTHGSISSDMLGIIDENARMSEFSTQDDAVLKCLRLIDALGLEIQAGTRKAVTLAIECGWHSPEMTKTIIAEAIAAQKISEGS